MSSLVGKPAPLFEAKAVRGDEILENFKLSDFIGKKYVVLFFYPKDFTFVCPTELHAFQEKLSEFEKRNVQLIACSTDTEFCHWTWLRMPRHEGGIQGITYPIVADCNKVIAEAYDVLAGDYVESQEGEMLHVEGELIALRGLFLIDKQGIIQHLSVNNMSLGRSVDEALRMVDALQFVENNGEVCPANWNAGKKGFKPNHHGVSHYLEGK